MIFYQIIVIRLINNNTPLSDINFFSKAYNVDTILDIISA